MGALTFTRTFTFCPRLLFLATHLFFFAVQTNKKCWPNINSCKFLCHWMDVFLNLVAIIRGIGTHVVIYIAIILHFAFLMHFIWFVIYQLSRKTINSAFSDVHLFFVLCFKNGQLLFCRKSFSHLHQQRFFSKKVVWKIKLLGFCVRMLFCIQDIPINYFNKQSLNKVPKRE